MHLIYTQNNDLKIYEKDNIIFGKSFNNINITDLVSDLAKFPRVKISNFINLKKLTLNESPGLELVLGELKDKFEINVSPDEMSVYLKLNLLKDEYISEKENIKSLIIQKLHQLSIFEGFDEEILNSDLFENIRPIIVKGVYPINGNDAKIEYFKISEKKPTIKKDGSADHYDINLIDEVNKGTILGTKINSTPGIPGKTIFGKILQPKPGKDISFKYDRESVEEIKENGIYVLKAKIPGAVNFKDNKIMVSNHISINGDIGPETGNIEFDGHITINGTVLDTYSVIATKDISINSKNGLVGANKIISKEGSISIVGGVNGKGITEISAAQDVFVKYVNESKITAGRNINIGIYAIDSELKAKKIELSKDEGKIIGGIAIAEHQLITNSIGTKFEKKTDIIINGFNRDETNNRLEQIEADRILLLEQISKLSRQIEVFEINLDKLDDRGLNTYNFMKNSLDELTIKFDKLDEEELNLNNMLKTKGEGEVKIYKNLFPKSNIEIKNTIKKQENNSEFAGSYYFKDGKIHISSTD